MRISSCIEIFHVSPRVRGRKVPNWQHVMKSCAAHVNSMPKFRLLIRLHTRSMHQYCRGYCRIDSCFQTGVAFYLHISKIDREGDRKRAHLDWLEPLVENQVTQRHLPEQDRLLQQRQHDTWQTIDEVILRAWEYGLKMNSSPLRLPLVLRHFTPDKALKASLSSLT